MSSESIFGHNLLAKEYDPPISQSSVMQQEADLSMRPTVDDTNPSTTSVFSSDRVAALLTTKLSSADVKDYAVSTQETADQTVKRHVLTEQTTFDADQQLVSKKYCDDNSSALTPSSSSNNKIITVSNGQMTFPNIHIGTGSGSNTVIGELTTGGAWANTTLLAVYAGYQANNLQDVTAVGWGASYYGNNCKHSTSIGMHSGLYRRNEYNTQVGQKAGALYSSASGASASGSHNTFLGAGSGENFGAGSGNLFLGSGVTAASGSNQLIIGRDGNHLIKGTIGTTANAEIELNADKIKVPTTLPTEADYANLDAGQIYVDTSDANVLKMK